MSVHHNYQFHNQLILMPPLWVILLIIGGCHVTPQTSLQAVSKQINQAKSCSDKPIGYLDSKNVKPLQISSKTVTETGQIRADQYLAYTFEAKSGQKLSYQTNDNICVWVYAPDNQLITTKDLSQSGKYIIQVSTPQGSTTFSLAMNLQNMAAESASSDSAKSLSSISDSASRPTQVDRPSPEKLIDTYYTNINSHNYQDAWSSLTLELQSNKEAHPNGYSSYLEWWQQVNSIDTQQVGTNNNRDTSTVTIKCKYHMKSGKILYATIKYYLTWREAKNTWQINNVKRI
ncbi:hypothetical protein NIES37_38050 [Tolypothrix tenuis PCC 7101]|uniref:ARC6 IMS domain-containing protein n=2 Tax=Tolypothrix TaxID=111782 RepID=A0A1Z4N261_9CYAN|nr:hypothetical protein [Aulosira sp. FACHB-113]BAY99822.1 hypothetical protein NIES37_38050 [Tolypothrix tenuis PCC 7101]BAZ76256.1 hypothetical protein NIES50_48540 [Aulosira laxa NIES-50]